MKVLATGTPQNRLKSAINDAINPVIFLLVSVIFTAVFFTTRNGAPNDTSNGFSCRFGNPTFPWQGNWNRVWDPSLFLSITLAQGNFTFSQAKAIDICWDLVVGRGGQMYAAYVAYQVMRRSLLRSLESRPMHIPVTTSLIFEGLSISAFGKVSKDLASTARKEGRWNWRLVGYLCMIMYLLSFGTIVSAMTGYQAQMTPFYSDHDTRSLVASSNINSTEASDGVVVRDGQRIGLDDDAMFLSRTSLENVTRLRQYSSWIDTGTHYDYNDCGQGAVFTMPNPPIPNPDVIVNFRFMNTSETSGTCQYINSSITLHGKHYSLPTGELALDVRNDTIYVDQGRLINTTWLQQTSVCQPGKSYEWGFSSQLLFLFCMMTIVYAAILAALQWDVWWYGQANWFKQRHGLYRDILDVAEELKCELKEELKYSNGQYLTADVLEEVLSTNRGALCVSTEILPPPKQALGFSHMDNRFGAPMYRLGDKMEANLAKRQERREALRKIEREMREVLAHSLHEPDRFMSMEHDRREPYDAYIGRKKQERADIEEEAAADYEAFLGRK